MDEQEAVFKKVLPLFNNYKTVVLGDREFCSIKLANWLTERKVYFCLRLKKDAFIEIEAEIWLQLRDSGLAPGLSFFYQGIKYTKSQGFVSFNLAAKWKRKRLGVAPKEGWFILTNLDDLDSAIKAYKQRFDIEEMFRDFKSGGYNLSETLDVLNSPLGQMTGEVIPFAPLAITILKFIIDATKKELSLEAVYTR